MFSKLFNEFPKFQVGRQIPAGSWENPKEQRHWNNNEQSTF